MSNDGDHSAAGLGPDTAALQRAANAAGHIVSARMLETFRAQDLIPRPRRTGHLGRVPEWRYPSGSERQLLALLEWRSQTKDTDLLTTLLWLDGFPITASAVRDALTRKLSTMIETVEREISQQASRLGLDPADETSRRGAIDVLAKTMAAKRGPGSLPRRGRMRAEDRSRALSMVIRMFGLGETIEPTASDADAVERLLGIAPNGRRHTISDSGPWLTGPAEDLFDAAEITGLPALLHAVKHASDRDLTAARQTIVALLYHLPLMIRMIGVLFGDENYTGLASLARADQQAEFVVFLAPLVIAMQRAGWEENLDMVVSALAEFPGLAVRAQQILEMQQATIEANVSGKPSDLQAQVRRLIDAALDGQFDSRATATSSNEQSEHAAS
jgi:hypothetical protein